MNELTEFERNEKIQLLIDGGLNEDQQVKLLRQIDEEAPEAWRTVALGYHESEVLRSVFQEESMTESTIVVPLAENKTSKNFWATTAIAAVATILGIIVGVGFQPDWGPADSPSSPMAEETQSEPSDSPSPNFQAIESLDLALRERGLNPVVSNAMYQAELSDGRTLYLPIKRLSFQP